MRQRTPALLALLLLLVPVAVAAPCIHLHFPGYHAAGIDTDSDGSYELILELNHWNLATANGVSEIRYCLSNQTLHYHQDLRNIVYREKTVFGYPELYYGYKPWNGRGAYDGEVDLPAKLSELPRFWLIVNYSFTHQPGLPVNVATDTWITRAWKPGSVGSGDAEVMVWLYHSSLRPAGSPVATVSCPTYIDGKPGNAVYKVWVARFKWLYIAFLLDPPLHSGEVAVDYTCILENAARIAGLDTSMYVDDVELGVEYGLPGYTRAAFRWDVYRFYLTLHSPEKPLEASVTVVDGQGNPLPGVPVLLQGRPAGATSDDGRLALLLRPGLYTVEVPLHYSGRGVKCTFTEWRTGSTRNYTLLAPGYKGSAEAVYMCRAAKPAQQPPKPQPEPAPSPQPSPVEKPNITLQVYPVNTSGPNFTYTLVVRNTGDVEVKVRIHVEASPEASVTAPDTITVSPVNESRVRVAVHVGSPGTYCIAIRVEYGREILERVVNVNYRPVGKASGNSGGVIARGLLEAVLLLVVGVAIGVATLVVARKLGKV